MAIDNDAVNIDMNVELHGETERAWLVSDDGEHANAEWVPKSCCELTEETPDCYVLVIPEYMAIQKGFA